uniref:Temporin-La n=1 Tax=Aquarana catesbeiana TaxID=8400 RepID=TPA_AQUCT|nr:RecName: Full=Temporin-La; AltName: Full=Catesbeianin-1 protein; Flags: Precursor [Aquarana catesbeiana]ACQ65676.1 catesbeianin-1 protein precursor [Aquarana catesbeiana]
MFPLKKSLLLLFFLGTINLSFCEEERDVDQDERRDDPGERNVQVEKRLLRHVVKILEKYLGK